MPPPSRAHTTATGSYQVRQNRNARARHSLDNTGFSIDSSDLPSGLIVDYSIDDIVRPGNIAELGLGPQGENIHLDDEEEEEEEDDDDEDADIDAEEVDLGKANCYPFVPAYLCLFCSRRSCLQNSRLVTTYLPAKARHPRHTLFFCDCEPDH
jgi:hypothetical protein